MTRLTEFKFEVATRAKSRFFAAAVLVFAAISLLASGRALAEPARRSLEIELEDVPGVRGYEIRVVKILEDGTKKPPVYFKIKGNNWSAKLLPGKYAMEVRSYDSRDVPGDWSPPQDFVVKLPAAEPIEPAEKAEIKSDDDVSEKVTFSWKPVEGAEKYKIKIFNADGTVAQEAIEKTTSDKFKLPVAHAYTWMVTPVMAGEIEGDAAEQPSRFTIVGGSLDKPKMLPVDDINTTSFEWGGVKYANQYVFKLEIEDKEGHWKPFDEQVVEGQKRIFRNALPTGNYRMAVRALGDLRQPSDFKNQEFKTVFVNSRNPAAIAQVRDEMSYDSKSTLFAIASYYVTFVNYTSKITDSANQHDHWGFDAIGGTGRLGAGTWFKENSAVGLMATADLSGFTINDQTSTYGAGTLQGVYRYRLGALGQFRASAGLQYRDLPVTISNAAGNAVAGSHVSKLSTMGPMVSATLLHGFSRKIGLQVNLLVSDSAFGISTPDGQSNVAQISYQASLLGSLNLGPGLVGFMGYSYRTEAGAYTNAQGTDTDTSQLSGHYLNFLMEYGF